MVEEIHDGSVVVILYGKVVSFVGLIASLIKIVSHIVLISLGEFILYFGYSIQDNPTQIRVNKTTT